MTYVSNTRLPDAILFDLDGTLLDTARDLINAVNIIRKEDSLAPIPMHTLRPWVSQGGLQLISKAYGLSPDSDEADVLWRRYLIAYESNISQYSRLFDGMDEILKELETMSIPWGIVTNKPTYLTDRLLRNLGMRNRPACMICSDSASRPKPWPDPVWMACRTIGVSTKKTLMIGDDKRDVMAARSAGADAVAAAWGYIQSDDDPTLWGASAVLSHPSALWDWISERSPIGSC